MLPIKRHRVRSPRKKIASEKLSRLSYIPTMHSLLNAHGMHLHKSISLESFRLLVGKQYVLYVL